MTDVEPDRGAGVVATWAQAELLPRPPLLVLDSITRHLDGLGLGTGPVRWARIGDGQSNVTFLLQRDDRSIVLRRGPRPPLPPSAHDMVREARMQTLLAQHAFPVPDILDVCEDARVLGVPFYLMAHVDGVVITDRTPPAFDSAAARRATSEAVVDALVALHGIDARQGELAALGRPAGYLERQVRRFGALWPGNTRREIPAVGVLGAWLGEHLPVSQGASVVHGDYRIGNLMFRPDAPPTVAAVLDWEMSTLGDPLADLGYLAATYAEAGEPGTVMELTGTTREDGYLRRDDLIERYARSSAFDLTSLSWYEAFALWKAAIFCEAIYTRYLDGQRPGDEFGPRLERGVPDLLGAAARFAGIAVP